LASEKTSQAIESYKRAVSDLESIDTTLFLSVVLIVLFFILGVLLFIITGNRIKKKIKYKLFSKYAREKELTEEEINILWKYSETLNRDPFLTLEFKAPFEKIVNEYINRNSNFNENIVKDMRKKLGFDVVPEVVPIVVTKDIDLFQNGKLITADGNSYSIVLYEKDEKFMYWMVIETNGKPPVSIGEVVKLTFVRKGDAIYNVMLPIRDIIVEDDKLIVKLPHTFDLVRIQRREFPRVNVDIDAFIRRIDISPEVLKDRPIKWNYVRIVNISAGGMRICIPPERRTELNIYIGHKIEVKFELIGRHLKLEGTIVNMNESRRQVCYGIKFDNVSKDIVEFISKYVKDEQQKIIKMIKGNSEVERR